MPKTLNPDKIRRKLAGTRMPEDPLKVDVSQFSEQMRDQILKNLLPGLRPAGVLIPLIERQNEVSVLLTERSADLRHHAGQVSFPGGGMEPHDADITATALREAHEEVGIHPAEVDIAGYLNPTPTITGFAVTPVVGFVQSSFTLQVDPVEVESAFEVPLEFLMDASNEQRSEREIDGVTYPVVTFHYEGYRIWGATAGILMALRTNLLR